MSTAQLVQALSDAYAVMCALPPRLRVYIQPELSACRDALATAANADPEEIQDAHELTAFSDPRRLDFLLR